MILEIVVPCYNEQEVLPETSTRLVNLLTRLIDQGKISEQSKIYFIDDGSTDQTWPIIRSMAQENPLISGIKLSKNCGHQHALLAGLFTATGDAVISIDADLQDDVNVIEEMLGEFEKGHDIVYGIRKNRKQDTLIKRYSAESYYKFLLALGVRVVFNHADFRLLSRRALENLKEFKEVNLFLRGLIPLLGFPSSVVYYNRENRAAGTSKYPVKKVLGLALDGITSFSIGPLRFITALGFFIFFPIVAREFLDSIYTILHGAGRSRLGVYGPPDLFHRRNTDIVFRDYWRIPRQDLYGNEKKAKVYHRGNRVRLLEDSSLLGDAAQYSTGPRWPLMSLTAQRGWKGGSFGAEGSGADHSGISVGGCCRSLLS